MGVPDRVEKKDIYSKRLRCLRAINPDFVSAWTVLFDAYLGTDVHGFVAFPDALREQVFTIDSDYTDNFLDAFVSGIIEVELVIWTYDAVLNLVVHPHWDYLKRDYTERRYLVPKNEQIKYVKVDGVTKRYTYQEWHDMRTKPVHPVRKEYMRIAVHVRQVVFTRDNHTCQYCGAKSSLQVDHNMPIDRGGTNDLDNLITLCQTCNYSKHTKTWDEWITWKQARQARFEHGETPR